MSFRGNLSPYKANNQWNVINLYQFSTKFPYFSSYDNFYCIEICLPTTYFTSSRCVLKHGFAKFGLFFSKRPAGFNCRKRPSPTFANFGHIAHGRYRVRHRYISLIKRSFYFCRIKIHGEIAEKSQVKDLRFLYLLLSLYICRPF